MKNIIIQKVLFFFTDIESLHKARGELQKQTFEIKQRERDTLNRKYELMTQLSKIKMETMTEEQTREVLIQGKYRYLLLIILPRHTY